MAVVVEAKDVDEFKALAEKEPSFAVWAEHVRRFEPLSPEKLLEIFLYNSNLRVFPP